MGLDSILPTLLLGLASDPKEADDLAAKHPDIVGRLLEKMDAWWDPGVAAGEAPADEDRA